MHACSIGSRAAIILRPGATGRVLGCFEHACDLVMDSGAVIALVWGNIGNGPLNVVLCSKPNTPWPAGTQFAMREMHLVVGAGVVDLTGAARWDARPDWDALRVRRDEIAAAARAARHDWQITGLTEQRLLKQAGPAVAAAVDAFRQAWGGDNRAALQSAICNLCGLGPGLTPAGDDWLAGWLLAQHLASDPIGLPNLSGLVANIAATRTTTLSRAFLECAAAGEADADWHDLLHALAAGSHERIGNTTQRILSHGATSGAAMLSGFLSSLEHPPDL